MHGCVVPLVCWVMVIDFVMPSTLFIMVRDLDTSSREWGIVWYIGPHVKCESDMRVFTGPSAVSMEFHRPRVTIFEIDSGEQL